MNQNIDIDNSTIEVQKANAIKRNLAGLIDGAIILVLFFVSVLYLPHYISVRFQNLLYILLFLSIYRLLCLLSLNATIGMRLSRIKLLNDYLKPLSLKEKIMAAFFILVNGIAYYSK